MRFILLLSMALFPAFAAVSSEAPVTYDRIHLSGSATGEVANDTVVALLYAQREGQQAAALADEVNGAIAWALAQAAGSEGIKAQTLDYQTQPVYQNQRLSGWRVRQSLRLESRDASRLASLVGTLQARLAVQSIGYQVSPARQREAEEGLIVEALAAFRGRAELVREQLGAAGYRLVELRVDGGGPVPMPRTAMATMEMRGAATPPALEPGTRDLSVSVSGTIELERR